MPQIITIVVTKSTIILNPHWLICLLKKRIGICKYFYVILPTESASYINKHIFYFLKHIS